MDSTSAQTLSAINPFTAINLTDQLQAKTSPLLRQRKISGYEFDTRFEVNVKQAHASKLVVEQLFRRTGVAYATADFSANATMNITTTAYFSAKNKFKPFFGIPYTSIFEGTTKTAAYEIAPIKGTSVAGTYTVSSGFDYLAWAGTPSLVYRTQIERPAGTSSQVFVYAIEIEYIDYVVTEGAAT